MTDMPITTDPRPRIHIVADDEPAPPPAPGAIRKRGRPKGQLKTGGRRPGVKNWSNKEIRDELLARSDVVSVLSDIISGKELLVAGPTGRAHSRRPTLQQRLAASTSLLSMLYPRGIELSGPDQGPIETADTATSPRELAKSLLSIIATGAPDGSKITLDPPGTHVARFRDAALGERILPNTDAPPDDTPEPEPPPAQLGERIVIDRRIAIRFVEIMPDGREKWTLGRVSEETGAGDQLRYVILEYAIGREAAERRAMQLIKDGKA